MKVPSKRTRAELEQALQDKDQVLVNLRYENAQLKTHAEALGHNFNEAHIKLNLAEQRIRWAEQVIMNLSRRSPSE